MHTTYEVVYSAQESKEGRQLKALKGSRSSHLFLRSRPPRYATHVVNNTSGQEHLSSQVRTLVVIHHVFP